ncbi:Yip1 family protein [Planococcus lenghuensis]|nr:Yip1 family protein [Planococcus lenghuensis]
MEETKYHDDLNPFTAIWLRPREITRYVIEEKSSGYIWLLIALTGIAASLGNMSAPGTGESIPGWGAIILAIIFGPVAGIIGAAFAAGVFLWIGKLFQGTGTYSELFRAVAAAGIPQIWLLPLLFIWMLLSPETFFWQVGYEPLSGGQNIFWMITFLISAVVGIWGFVIQCLGVAEAHRFSGWKGFFTVLLPLVLFVLFIILIFILLIGMSGFSSY